jgi:hypothetical protein
VPADVLKGQCHGPNAVRRAKLLAPIAKQPGSLQCGSDQ